VTELPYFEGDFWPNVLEDIIKEQDQEEEEKRKREEAEAAAAEAEGSAGGDEEEPAAPVRTIQVWNNASNVSVGSWFSQCLLQSVLYKFVFNEMHFKSKLPKIWCASVVVV